MQKYKEPIYTDADYGGENNLKRHERMAIIKALQFCQTIGKTYVKLGISERTLQRKMYSHAIEQKEWKHWKNWKKKIKIN